MKIETPQQLHVQQIAGEFDSIQAGIDNSSLPFILEMLSKSFYSNPIGSIVREITSNCFDSHTEAKVDDAVVISKVYDYDEESHFICFQDKGMGLSPDRIKNVYMSYFKSTKRDSDDQIGGFGLGSKTPLAYSDYFYIITISEGKKYTYVFSKGDSLPTLDLLLEEETEEHNGTTIKIPFQDRDLSKFNTELRKQLCYFDNVYFQKWDVNNHYTIYEGKYFKYRNKDQYSDEAHICFGKVAYPIDWDEINMLPLEIGVGIKFEISELVVTPNREALRYTDNVKTILRERINQAKEELENLYYEQAVEIEDFFVWFKSKNERKHIMFGDSDKLFLTGFEQIEKRVTLKYFRELGIDTFKIKEPITQLFERAGQISYGKIVKNDWFNLNDDSIVRYKNNYIISEDRVFNDLQNWIHRSKNIIKKKPVNKALLTHFYQNFISKENKDQFEYRLDKYRLAYKVIKYIQQQVYDLLGTYVTDITDEEKATYKAEKIANDANLQRKLTGKVFVKDIIKNDSYDLKLSELEDYNGIVVYGHREDTKALMKALTFLKSIKRLQPRYVRKSKKLSSAEIKIYPYKIFQISQQNAKYFNKKTMIHVNNLYSDNKLFRELASVFKIEDYFAALMNYQSTYHELAYIKCWKEINSSIGENLDFLHSYRKVYVEESNNTLKQLKDEILKVANKNNLFNPRVEEKFKELDAYFKGVELLRFIDLNEDSLPIVLKELRAKKKKLNFEYYAQVVKDEETQCQMILNFDENEEDKITKFQLITKAA